VLKTALISTGQCISAVDVRGSINQNQDGIGRAATDDRLTVRAAEGGPASSPRNRSSTPGAGSRGGPKAKVAREVGCSRRVLYDVLSAQGACAPPVTAGGARGAVEERMTGDVRPDDYVALLEAVKDEIAASTEVRQ